MGSTFVRWLRAQHGDQGYTAGWKLNTTRDSQSVPEGSCSRHISYGALNQNIWRANVARYVVTVFLSLALVAGCASMDAIMSSWKGRSIDDLTTAWGVPQSRLNRTDGGATYTWTTFSSNQNGVQQCRQTFVTNPSGIIVTWSYAGCAKFVRTW